MRVLYKAFICDDSCICRVRRWYECMYGCVYIDDCQVCPRGPMDKASAYEAGDCGFESRRRLSFFLDAPGCVPQSRVRIPVTSSFFDIIPYFHNKHFYTWISTVYCFIHFIPIIYSSYAAWYLYDSNSFCVLTKYPTSSIHKTYLNPFYIGCIASRWVWATSSDASQWDAYMLVGGTHTVFKGHRHIGKPKHCFVTITRT